MPASGSRLSRADRREQLVSLGLTMLEQVPLQQLSVDDVAARAGISRSLLFHYFPTKQAFFSEVVRAASVHVLDITQVPEGVSSGDPARSVIAPLVRYIMRRRDNYVSVVRSARLIDPALEEVIADFHRTMCLRMLETVGETDPDPHMMLAMRSWLAAVEESALLSAEYGVDQDTLIDNSLSSFRHLVGPKSSARG